MLKHLEDAQRDELDLVCAMSRSPAVVPYARRSFWKSTRLVERAARRLPTSGARAAVARVGPASALQPEFAHVGGDLRHESGLT
jgi:hypothetical protein